MKALKLLDKPGWLALIGMGAFVLCIFIGNMVRDGVGSQGFDAISDLPSYLLVAAMMGFWGWLCLGLAHFAKQRPILRRYLAFLAIVYLISMLVAIYYYSQNKSGIEILELLIIPVCATWAMAPLIVLGYLISRKKDKKLV